MVIYEVNLQIEADIAQAYCAWLKEHIEEILALKGFISAAWYEVESGSETAKVEYCIQYTVSDRANLERYFQEDAPRLRQDGLKQFPNQFTAHRRILAPYPSP